MTNQPFERRDLQRVTQALRLRGPLASDPTARMLHALVLSLAIWFAFWSVVLIPLYPHRGIRLLLAVLQEIGPVMALVILRAGSLRWASVAYLAGTLVYSNIGAVTNGGIEGSGMKYALMLPILATWLLGYRAAMWTAFACMSSAAVIAILQTAGMKFGPPVTTPIGGWLTHIQIILVGVVPVAQILERLKRESKERERKEHALIESEQRFRNIADTAPITIMILDAEGRATFANKTWLTFTGRTMEQELGEGWTSVIHTDDWDECLTSLWDSYKSGSQYELEYRLRRSDGQYRSVLCKGVPRYEPDGALAGYIQSLIDITDLKRALANQKLESLGVLASGIAHDFNNLLGGILASSELLLSDLPSSSPERECLEQIKTIAIRASEIVRQLMVYAGEESTVFEELDMAELVREMLRLMMVSITKSAVLKIDVPANVPYIRGNSAQLRQVVMNLITNASDALREKGGSISVQLTQVHAENESIPGATSEAAHADFLRLEVSDSGCGMSEEIQARIFDPFFSTKRAGRGMGLAAVRGIVQSHGGTITVQSAVGSGSTFEILLPCIMQTEQLLRDLEVPKLISGYDDATPSVLIIDDEDVLRVPVANMLRKKGFSVFESGDGTAGLELFQSRAAEIDIVLLDLTLPGMSGAEVLKELRKLRPHITIILATAYGRDRALADVDDPDSVYYLRKPYEIEELTALVRRVYRDQPAVVYTPKA